MTFAQMTGERPWYKNWPEGVPKHIDYPEKTLADLLRERAENNPKDVQFIFYDRRITFEETDRYVNRLAYSLQKLGLGARSRVAIMLPNSPQFAFAYYAVNRIGGTIVPINPLYTQNELKNILRDSEAETIFVLDTFYTTLKQVKDDTSIRNVIVTNIGDFMPPVKAFLGRLLKKIPTSNIHKADDVLEFKDMIHNTSTPEPVSVDIKREPAVFMYTGGTTGIPKAAMLTNFNLVSNCIMLEKWAGLNSEDTILAVLPWFHVYGMTAVLNLTLSVGLKAIVLPRFSVKETLEAVKKYRPTSFPGVFSMYIALLNSPQFNSYKQYFSSLRASISGAAPLPLNVAKSWKESTGTIIAEGYGLSEASPVTHANPLKDPSKIKMGSIGIPLPDTDAKIVDIETGTKELPVNQQGELVVSGPQVGMGYWNRKEETEMTFRNGWLYTGDIGYMDEDGYFYIVDRKKDMINVGGLKVYPREVEEVAYQHPSVRMAAVIGVPEEFHGEVPKLFVVLKDEYKGKVSSEEIVAFMRERLAPYKVPKYVEFKDELPTTLVGKVLRRRLKEEGEKKK
ncbi:MAG: long-chain fatty acid--CoA ligase [Conexivisphaerales archaeon]